MTPADDQCPVCRGALQGHWRHEALNSMCSQSDDPTTYDAPTPQQPRSYVLSGAARTEPEPSVALAVIGDMLHEAETTNRVGWTIDAIRALRAARARIAEAGG